MRRLLLRSLVALAVLPLSAHSPWRRPRRVVVVERDACGDVYRDSYRRWDDDARWERRAYSTYPGYARTYRDDDCAGPRGSPDLAPTLAPPPDPALAGPGGALAPLSSGLDSRRLIPCGRMEGLLRMR